MLTDSGSILVSPDGQPSPGGVGAENDLIVAHVSGDTIIIPSTLSEPLTINTSDGHSLGLRLTPTDSGGFLLVDKLENPHSVIYKPWARDALGTPVPVEYRLNGDALEMHVPHRSEKRAYPVVVDPLWKKIKKAVKDTIDTIGSAADAANEVASDYVVPIAQTAVGVGQLTVAFSAGVTGAVTANPALLVIAVVAAERGVSNTYFGVQGLRDLADKRKRRPPRRRWGYRSIPSAETA
jgi:hypothetical protein